MLLVPTPDQFPEFPDVPQCVSNDLPLTYADLTLEHQQAWRMRKVDNTLCINFDGVRWDVRAVPGVRVGELVHVLATRSGQQLHAQLVYKPLPTVLVPRAPIQDAAPLFPDTALLGADYAGHPAPAPAPANYCAQCGAALLPHGALPLPASPVKG